MRSTPPPPRFYSSSKSVYRRKQRGLVPTDGLVPAHDPLSFASRSRTRLSQSRNRCVSQRRRMRDVRSPAKTTKPYDRTSDQITLDEVERIVICIYTPSQRTSGTLAFHLWEPMAVPSSSSGLGRRKEPPPGKIIGAARPVELKRPGVPMKRPCPINKPNSR
jgi:hypothetical protein